jgi:xanthine dehydrogenase YagR molybdenum-binding subunit
MNRNTQKPKVMLEPKMESVIQVKLPMVRDFSTGDGHGPGDTIVEGDEKIVTKKWQGYAPQNLNVIGKPMPPMPEVAMPRFTGKAEYASRVMLPNMLHLKVLISPHPRARLRNIDISRAEKMPGVAYVLTYKNAPSTFPMPQELNFQGEIVAFVAAETEDLAEDAIEALQVDYEVLPFVSTLKDVMSPNAPDLRGGQGNLFIAAPTNPHYDPNATFMSRHGDIERGFAEADVVKEFAYTFGGATAVPIQPCSGVAKWDGDKLTFWGHGQGIYPFRASLAAGLGIDAEKIRFINKYNGCTLGAAQNWSLKFNPYIAYISKMVGRPVRIMLAKDQELAHLAVKPENVTKFKVGTRRDGKIVALLHEVWQNDGDTPNAGLTGIEIALNNQELYTSGVPHWKTMWYSYKTNVIRSHAVRSATQQEVKWAWENMIDEMAEALAMDPIQFRLLNISKPGTKLSPARDWHAGDLGSRYELENGELTYDSFASVEVLEEGAEAMGWDKRNPKPGGTPGRFKKGIGVGMSQHHPGHMGYHDQEVYFEKVTAASTSPGLGTFGGDVEVNADGNVIMKMALPDSGTNHATALATIVAEMLGFTTRDRVRVVWGDTDLAPASGTWNGGHTITLQGAATCSAADKLRRDLLKRASDLLKVDGAKLQMRDGLISSVDDPKKRITFAALAAANKGVIRQSGRGVGRGQGRSLAKGVGACFVEVEVDTWTGDWKLLRSVYSHDVGLVVNPLVGEADMHGSLVECVQMTTDALPYDREFPGTRHYSVGYLSYRIPTIMDVPEQQTQVFIDSLEPRWFYGIKSFSETTIGAVPGALSNAIYNACGVRVREHPITREKIMAGLKALGGRS